MKTQVKTALVKEALHRALASRRPDSSTILIADLNMPAAPSTRCSIPGKLNPA